jgi:tRNA1(Val) A37 N6-methylase TrmN6
MGRPGILRPARRPAGWRAPGPPPAGPGERVDLRPGDGEDLCHLLGDWRIFQRLDGHRWSTDDLVTAWYAVTAIDGHDVACHVDLGCGIGSVLLMIAWCLPAARSIGVEAQATSVALAERSIAYDGVDDRVRVLHADLRALPAGLGPCGLVTGTPPYFDPAAGTVSDQVQRGPCRFELRGGLEEYATAAVSILAPDGRFVACAGPGRHDRIQGACGRAGLAAQRLRDVVPRAGRPPRFTVFVAARGGARPPIVEPPLVVRDAAGRRTAEFRALRARMGLPPHFDLASAQLSPTPISTTSGTTSA